MAGWTTYGTNLHLAESSWAWRLPTVVQCFMPAVVMAMIMFFPETPRWLLSKDRREEAIAIMAKYHGEGDPVSPIPSIVLITHTDVPRTPQSSNSNSKKSPKTLPNSETTTHGGTSANSSTPKAPATVSQWSSAWHSSANGAETTLYHTVRPLNIPPSPPHFTPLPPKSNPFLTTPPQSCPPWSKTPE